MLEFIMIFWGGLVVAWRRVWPCARLWEHAYPAGGIVCSRLTASRSHRKVTVCTPCRRGVPFTRVRRRGLCSMSGRYPYGIDNPPTLRRSSFPQRALRPAGGPIPKHTWGCAPRPPNAKLRLDTNWTFQQMLKSRSVRRRRYALKVPAAHFNLAPAGTELK